MKQHKIRIALIVMILTCGSLACSLSKSPTPFVYPTPDYTLTAIYSVLLTPQTPVLVKSATLQPTAGLSATAVPSFPTSPPAVTATTTPTITPTTTPVPTNTSAPMSIPLIRSAASVVATYLSSPPNVDGNLSNWTLTQYAVTHIVYGVNKWDNAADLSGSVMVGWDYDYLYLGARVVDEDYIQLAHSEDLYMGDSLEALLDTNLASDFYTTDLSPDDFQLGISPGSPEPSNSPEAYLWFPRTVEGGRSKVKIAAVKTGDGYNVEVAIPWSVFEMTPVASGHYGFAFSISDNDKDGAVVQQSMASNAPDRHLTYPTTWGDLLLSKP